jgi:hypothetical protein
MIEQSLTKTKIRIAIAYLTFALIPILVLGIFTNFVVLTHLKDDSEHALKMEAFIIAETLKDKVEATVAVATLFSKRRLLIASIKKGDPKDVTRHLQSFIDGIPDMERVTITNLEGKVIYTSLLQHCPVTFLHINRLLHHGQHPHGPIEYLHPS